LTLPLLVVAVVMVGSLAWIVWVVLKVEDQQIPLLAFGFIGLGGSFVAIAVAALAGMWRAASRSEGGRAFVLAVVGGVAGLAAIGALTVTALLTMVWNT
jgi:hypothetical protein